MPKLTLDAGVVDFWGSAAECTKNKCSELFTQVITVLLIEVMRPPRIPHRTAKKESPSIKLHSTQNKHTPLPLAIYSEK